MSEDTRNDDSGRGQRLARASAWMALGTITSRITGFLRLGLLAATIGTALDADIFETANTVPNSLYILVAGGVFNVVLVPQLVRTMKRDADRGEAYAQRVITLGLLVLALATAVLTLAVPWILRLVFNEGLFDPQLAAQRDSAELLMYLCMPQVFFYGAFVLIGQVLNAHERFGPMMWAPVLNNVVACSIIGTYLVIFGSENGRDGFTTNQALLLGLGSTAGIAVQLFMLLPFLRSTGFGFRPRFDFRGVGLGHTMRLGAWTLLYIAANQVAFIVINRLATRGSVAGATDDTASSGAAVYAIGFLVSQVPHGVITVSLATAIMPTLSALAADKEHRRFRLELGRTLRITMSIVAPLAVAVACLGAPAAAAVGFGALSESYQVVGTTIMAFSVAMISFTIHYLMLRGFYADEDTKTPSFIQIGIAVVSISLAVLFSRGADPADVAWRLALAYGLAYVVGATVSTVVLSRRVGAVIDAETVRFAVRLCLALLAAGGTMLAIRWGLGVAGLTADEPVHGMAVVLVSGIPGAVVYLLATRLMRMQELTYLLRSLRGSRS